MDAADFINNFSKEFGFRRDEFALWKRDKKSRSEAEIQWLELKRGRERE